MCCTLVQQLAAAEGQKPASFDLGVIPDSRRVMGMRQVQSVQCPEQYAEGAIGKTGGVWSEVLIFFSFHALGALDCWVSWTVDSPRLFLDEWR